MFLSRALVWKWLLGRPVTVKKIMGTVTVTSVGMFGRGGGWALQIPVHHLAFAVGGIEEKPRLVGGEPMSRQHLYLTVLFDHDVVDGAPAARFISRLKELMESAFVLSPA